MQINIVKRKFVQSKSVFKAWNQENSEKLKESIESDCSMWKLHKFMNKAGEEDEVSNLNLNRLHLDNCL